MTASKKRKSKTKSRSPAKRRVSAVRKKTKPKAQHNDRTKKSKLRGSARTKPKARKALKSAKGRAKSPAHSKRRAAKNIVWPAKPRVSKAPRPKDKGRKRKTPARRKPAKSRPRKPVARKPTRVRRNRREVERENEALRAQIKDYERAASNQSRARGGSGSVSSGGEEDAAPDSSYRPVDINPPTATAAQTVGEENEFPAYEEDTHWEDYDYDYDDLFDDVGEEDSDLYGQEA